jgi:hypothetical protein
MHVISRRAALYYFVAAVLSNVAGCSRSDVVVGPGTGGGKRGIKNQEDVGRKTRRGGRQEK